MEIKFVERIQIDDSRWNKCIEESTNGNVYAYTWYLDVVAPNWGALITPDYSHVFPLPYTSRFGQRIGYHPLFAQQLGLFSKQNIDEQTLLQFIQHIPFKKFEIQLNSANKIDSNLYQCQARNNFKLNLQNGYELLFSRYNRSNRKNCVKANDFGIKVKRINFDEYWEFYIEHTKFIARKAIYMRLNELIKQNIVRNTGFIYGAYSIDGILCSVLFVAQSHACVYTLFGDSSELGFQLRAKFLIFDQLIRNFANTPTILDFEGSDMPNVASVFEGFGSTRTQYIKIKYDKLPFIIQVLIKIEDWTKNTLKRILLKLKS